jgi:hypothetical protein
MFALSALLDLRLLAYAWSAHTLFFKALGFAVSAALTIVLARIAGTMWRDWADADAVRAQHSR